MRPTNKTTMNEELEKLKRERDEILAKVEELDQLTHDPEGGINWPQVHAIFEELKALKPKPERLRCWIERDRGGLFEECHFTEPSASLMGRIRTQQNTIHPMIEVRPLPELPEMEEWKRAPLDTRSIYCNGELIGRAYDESLALAIADAHNATVRAFKKWAEDAKKEVGDE